MAKFITVTECDTLRKIRINPEHIRDYYDCQNYIGAGVTKAAISEIHTGDHVWHWVKETPEEINKLIAEAEAGNETDQMIGRLRCESCWNYKARQDGLSTETFDILGSLKQLMRDGQLDFLKAL